MDPNLQPAPYGPTQPIGQVQSPDSNTNQTQPQKYKVFQALKDVINAVKHNPASTITASILLLVSTGIIGFIIVFLWIALFAAGLFISAWGGSAGLIALVVLLGVIGALLQIAIGTIFSNTLLLAIYNGGQGQKSSLGNDIKLGAKRFVRVALANMLLGIILAGPMIVTAILGILLSSTGNGSAGINIFVFLSIAGSMIWIIIALLRFALIPIVALFEPEMPLLKTPSRSSNLLVKGGQWFLFKAVLLLYVAMIVFSLITGASANSGFGEGSSNIFLNLLFVLIIPIVVGVPVMLYINRKSVKG